MSNFVRKIYKGNLDWLAFNTIFLTKYGSHAYGLATPESDLDIRGIVIPPQRYFYGYSYQFEQAEINSTVDGVIYNIQKFFKLAADGNPSIIEQLFVEDEDVIFINEFGKQIRDIRNEFVSKKIKHTFGGYAHSQVKRMQCHVRWMNKESEMRKPTRAEFGLPDHSVLSAEIRGAVDKLEVKFSDNVLELLHREREYGAACRDYDNYISWKKNRNPKRSEIERKIGYDGKHASQLIRLYLMAIEILSTGKVQVKRPEDQKEWLVGMKTGNTNWTYDMIMEFVESKSSELDALYETSTLQHTPNHNLLNSRLIEIINEYHKR